ncbi:MAG: hypothetical protein H0T48_13960 [Gemmatimonadaceae bacterium]|nr:hypothetical protein [Gemmatimonadaceae bacterium]
MDTETQLNRVIWMLWLQGFDKAPEVVRLCLRSWKTRNPTWQVIELDEENLSDYVDNESLSTLRGLDFMPQKFANLIRLYLISRHGGVWADATCYCCRPLDTWLPEYMNSGFFAFRFRTDTWLRRHADSGISGLRKRAGTKILANFFLAASKGNSLASTFYEKHRDFFVDNKFPLQHTDEGRERVRRIGRVLNRNARVAQWWTLPLIARAAKVYPYNIFHYHFAKTIGENETCRDVWNRTPTFYARGPLRLIRALVSPITDQQIDDLKQETEPLYKLTWKYRHEEFRSGCVLDYLLQSVPGSEQRRGDN